MKSLAESLASNVVSSCVGTERQPLSLTLEENQLSTADPEKTLLSATAAISLYQQAGKLPVTDDQPLSIHET